MSLPIDQYESLRQRVCPEKAIKPQLLGLQSLQNKPNASDTHQTYHFLKLLGMLALFSKLEQKEAQGARLNHEDWRNEPISEKLGILAGICGKARAKVRQQFVEE